MSWKASDAYSIEIKEVSPLKHQEEITLLEARKANDLLWHRIYHLNNLMTSGKLENLAKDEIVNEVRKLLLCGTDCLEISNAVISKVLSKNIEVWKCSKN